ncbi:MAG: penicillin-binding protein activator [Bdellovibrionota bacterium]|nr:penicillin-binding protein activator [Bdellovibrionota bacterium]
MKFILALISLSLIISCVSQPKKQEVKPTPPSIEQKFQKLREQLDKKPNAKVLSALENLAVKNPDLQVSAKTNLLLGDYYYEQKNYERAVFFYRQIINSPYFSSAEWQARLRAAKSLWIEKDSYQTLELLAPIFDFSDDTKVVIQAHELKAEISSFKGDDLEALKSMIFLSAQQTKKQEEYQLRAKQITQYELSRDDLSIVASNRSYSFVRPIALYKLGVNYFEESNYSKAESYLSDVVSIESNTALAERANSILTQIYSRSKVESYTIGVILPLSGRLESIGYKTLAGIQHGLGVFDKSSKFKIAVIDSEASPSIAKQAVEKLVIEDNVIAILGSVKGATSLAIAKKAQELGVPNIGFSLSSELTVTGDYVFRNALTSHMQVKTLVKTCMKKYGHKNFAILYPNDTYGIEFANIFWDEVLANGGEIRGAQSYSSKETDFRDPIRRLVGTYYREDRMDEYKFRLQEWQAKFGENTRRKIPEDLLPPIVDFDAIFIPDTSKALGQIAPMLVYNDIKTPYLLGTNLWNTNNVSKRAGSFKDQLLFVDTYTDYEKETAKKFVDSFENSFRRKPDTYEAIAYESSLLLKELIDKENIRSRTGLKEAISKLQSYPSALGLISVNEVGDIERPLRAMKVEKGQILQVK